MTGYYERYLNRIHFKQQLKSLSKRLRNKKIIIYGTGSLFQYINSNFDLSELNIIGISDRKYSLEQDGKIDLGYKIIHKSNIVAHRPDYVLVAMENYIQNIEDLEMRCFKDTSVKLLPFVRKSFFDIIKYIWNAKK